MNSELEQAVRDLLELDVRQPIFDDAGEVREEYEEGNWVAHPVKSDALQSILVRLKAAVTSS